MELMNDNLHLPTKLSACKTRKYMKVEIELPEGLFHLFVC